MAHIRREADSLGEMSLPADALYGVHTARAAANFPITGTHLGDYPELIQTLAMVKKAAALANMELGAWTAAWAAPFCGPATGSSPVKPTMPLWSTCCRAGLARPPT